MFIASFLGTRVDAQILEGPVQIDPKASGWVLLQKHHDKPNLGAMLEGSRFQMKVHANSDDDLTVAVYYLYQKENNRNRRVQAVPVSRNDQYRQYASNSRANQLVGSVRIKNKNGLQDVDIFVPDMMVGLGPGKYRFSFEIVVFQNNKQVQSVTFAEEFVRSILNYPTLDFILTRSVIECNGPGENGSGTTVEKKRVRNCTGMSGTASTTEYPL